MKTNLKWVRSGHLDERLGHVYSGTTPNYICRFYWWKHAAAADKASTSFLPVYGVADNDDPGCLNVTYLFQAVMCTTISL